MCPTAEESIAWYVQINKKFTLFKHQLLERFLDRQRKNIGLFLLSSPFLTLRFASQLQEMLMISGYGDYKDESCTFFL